MDDQNNPPAGGPSDPGQSSTGQAWTPPVPSADTPGQPEQPQTTGGTCTNCGGPTETSGNCPNCNPAPTLEPSDTGQAGGQ